MRMTPALLVIGGFAGLSGLDLHHGLHSRRDVPPVALGDLEAADGGGGRRQPALREKRMQLLSFAVHPSHGLGTRGAAHRRGRGLRRPPAVDPGHRAHRAGPFSGGRGAPGRLARRAFHQSALHQPDLGDAELGVPGRKEDRLLIAYMQAEGLKAADYRVERQKYWKAEAAAAYQSGPDSNVQWLHGHIPEVWQNMPNPYPASDEARLRGKKMYQEFCIGCHGPVGDGEGPAAAYLDPPPLNFTTLRRNLVQGKYIGGIFYYQIMNGITGTAMPYFKRAFESEKIWDLSNYVAVEFVGYTDAGIEPKGIDVSYENRWVNPYLTPQEAEQRESCPLRRPAPNPMRRIAAEAIPMGPQK